MRAKTFVRCKIVRCYIRDGVNVGVNVVLPVREPPNKRSFLIFTPSYAMKLLPNLLAP